MTTLGLKNVNLLTKGQYDTIAEPVKDELYAISESGFGFASDRYTDLSLGASGSSYKAPANGWVSFAKKTSAANQYIELGISNSIRMRDNNPVNGTICEAMLPVRKGQSFYASYTAAGDLTWLRFVYAEGE